MEKKIKTLYILSIISILAFLGMQVYWLYVRYDYSLQEYEKHAWNVIENTLDDYNKLRLQSAPKEKKNIVVHTLNNLNTDIDSTGTQKRTATISSTFYDGRELLGIKEDRKLTKEEMNQLAAMICDSIAAIEKIMNSFDVTSSPSDGAAWNAMKHYEVEAQMPFSVESIDSLLKKEIKDTEISLIVTDSMIWENTTISHSSIISPHFTFVHPYSELEKKSVVIDCKIPISEILRTMGWTLAVAIALSLFLILCLVWQINTIIRLKRLDKMRNMFVTTMIHELKRPISTLKMCVSGIESNKLMEDASLRKEIAGETRIALDNLSAYFTKLRDITFNNVEQIPLNVTSFNLNTLVDTVLKSIAIPSTKLVTFSIEVSAKTIVNADRSHLSNILTNLIENAIKYSGDEVTIKISAEKSNGIVYITVSDNGNGISSSDQKKIFNRFYRGRASSTDIPGMGLGLAYVKLLINAHCGTISVKSDENSGSTFTIKLPQ